MSRIWNIFTSKPPENAPTPNSHPCALYHDLVTIDSKIYPETQPLPCTAILKRCSRCANHITIVIAGEWSLSTLLRDQSEIAELEKLIQ